MSDIYELAKSGPKYFKEFYRESIAKDPLSTIWLAFANSKLNPDDLIEWHNGLGFIYTSLSKKNGIRFNTNELDSVHLYYWENVYSERELGKRTPKSGPKVFFNLRDDWEVLRPYFEDQQLEFREVLYKTIADSGQPPFHPDFDYRSGDPLEKVKFDERGNCYSAITEKLFHKFYLCFWDLNKALGLIDRHDHLRECSYCSAFFYLKSKSKNLNNRSYCSNQCASDYGNGKKPKL